MNTATWSALGDAFGGSCIDLFYFYIPSVYKAGYLVDQPRLTTMPKGTIPTPQLGINPATSVLHATGYMGYALCSPIWILIH